jgi:hypothetical protein
MRRNTIIVIALLLLAILVAGVVGVLQMSDLLGR